MSGLVVAGIGTEIGKTVCAAIVAEALGADYWKPVQAGGLDSTDTDVVRGLVSGEDRIFHPEAYRFTVPASPHAAAAADGVKISIDKLSLPLTPNRLVVELAGGLMVPLTPSILNVDLLERWQLPVVVVSNYYLGCINHTLLSVELLRQRNIPIAGLIFNGDVVAESRSVILSYTNLDCMLEVPRVDAVTSEFVKTYAREFRYESA